jgi:hypothetical protein
MDQSTNHFDVVTGDSSGSGRTTARGLMNPVIEVLSLRPDRNRSAAALRRGRVERSGSPTPQASVDDRPTPAEEPTISRHGASLLNDFTSITEEV